MKKNTVWMIVVICVLSAIVSMVGLLTSQGAQAFEFISITNETVMIYGTGIYAKDSISIVAQGVASDAVTLVLAIPVTLIALFQTLKQSFKAKLILTGMLGYFLYTYTSYTFLWNYNPLFIVYVVLMSLSFFTLVFMMLSFDLSTMKHHFRQPFKSKLILFFEWFIIIMLTLLWLSKLAVTWFSNVPPVGLEHYTTLSIQALDLGFIVPITLFTALQLKKQTSLGFLLSAIMIIKGIALLTSITAMMINMALSGVAVSLIEVSVFTAFNLLGVAALFSLLKQIKLVTNQ